MAIVGAGNMVEAESEDDFNYLERIDIDEEHRNRLRQKPFMHG